jgi:NAD-dependent deacetylase
MLKTTPHIVILTGAGISAESGVPTFRGSDGLWEGHRIEDVASPEGFQRDPALVQHFYNQRRAALTKVEPNAAHLALARLEQALGEDHVTLITQNVDDLHDRAGSKHLLHMHGELLKARCLACNAVSPWAADILDDSICPACSTKGKLRPHIVWFGEMPLYMDEIESALIRVDLFVAIGTSGKVYPAAGFVRMAAHSGADTIEFNLEPSDVSADFDEHRVGPASVEVTKWVDQVLSATP